MWTPNLTAPAVKMLCHRGPVTALAVDTSGRFMVTAGMDRRMKVCAKGFHMLADCSLTCALYASGLGLAHVQGAA
jgi:hypothetical protein